MRIVGAIYPSDNIYLIMNPVIESQNPFEGELVSQSKHIEGIVMDILNIHT